MPVGKCQRAFAASAAAHGIPLGRQSLPWLCEQGHVGLARVAETVGDPNLRRRVSTTVAVLGEICDQLGGDATCLGVGRSNRLRGDFLHEGSRTLVEIDESQHFTSFRLAALELYPADVELGFDLAQYKQLCRDWRRRSDGYRRHKDARCFGPGGRQRQRAYYDSLRDLAAPAMGYAPVIRIAALDDDGAAAFLRHEPGLLQRLTDSAPAIGLVAATCAPLHERLPYAAGGPLAATLDVEIADTLR